jgi:hypothetical protein
MDGVRSDIDDSNLRHKLILYYQIPMIGLSRPAGLIFGEILAGCSLAGSRGTLVCQDAETSSVCLVCLVYLVCLVIWLSSFNQTHETD